MQVPTHLAISWLIGHRLPERRDRRLVTWAGVLPDLDALSLLGGAGAYCEYHHVLTHGIPAVAVRAISTAFGGAGAYSEYHHVLTHSLVAAVVVTAISTAFARERAKVLLLSFLAFHVHLVCDLLGSGRDWPIVYFYPFSRHEYFTPYGWPLASPQNALVWVAAVALTVWVGITRGRTFAEAFLPARADAAVAKALHGIYERHTRRERPVP
jgi:membrane-bound metal-dependent hydrolase YbcI (DUF457 family)